MATNKQSEIEANNTYNARELKNANAKRIASKQFEELLQEASKLLSLDSLANWGIGITAFFGCSYYWLFIFTIAFIGLKIYLRKSKMIQLTFGEKEIADFPNFGVIVESTNSQKTWRVIETRDVKNKKYTAGADNLLTRKKCKASTTPPFPFKTNTQCATFKSKKETLFFLPAMLIVIQGTKVGAVDYADTQIKIAPDRFIEDGSVPSDAKIIDYTYKYVNKNGQADKRFNDNRKLPICLYGKLEVMSNKGLDTRLMFSRTDLIE